MRSARPGQTDKKHDTQAPLGHQGTAIVQCM